VKGGRSRERVREREREKERERERERDLDTSHIPGHNFLPTPLSVFPVTIRYKGYMRTLALDFHSFLAGL